MFALCDCNNFYVAAERVFRPELLGQPVVVLSNNDSCVIARSEEAKLLGICMGDPEFKIRGLLHRHQVRVLSSNYALYGDLSDRVMKILASHFHLFDVYSIDEAFARLDDGIADPSGYAVMVAADVLKCTGIPVSIGMGPNKTLAKVANRLAKKNGGIKVLTNDQQIRMALADFPIEDLWGIGTGYYNRLAAMGITTALQLRELPELFFKQQMSVQGQRMYHELWGRPAFDLQLRAMSAKVVSISRSFSAYITEAELLCQAVSNYAWRLAEKLREQRLCCRKLEIFLLTSRHRSDQPQHFPVHTHQMAIPCNDAHGIVPVVVRVTRMLFQPGMRYRKAGIVATGLIPESEVQLNLFTQVRPKYSRLSSAVDRINASFGRGTLRMASEGSDTSWKMKQNFLTRHYTTRWEDIVTVK